MKKIVLLCLFASLTFAQVKLTGTVIDEKTSVGLKEVNIICSNPTYSTTTNQNGNFIIENILPDTYTFTFSHIGYEPLKINVTVENEVAELNIKLTPISVELGEVLIVSLKNYQLQKTAPIPVEVVESKKIEVKSAVTVPDLLKQQSGLAISRDGIWGTNLSIRGLSRSNIVTLIDGNRIETATDIAAGLSLFNISDIERIEVVKGAASSLYGTGALGGVVNIISKSPSYQDNFITKGQLSTEYNGVNTGKGASLSMSASNHAFRLKLTLSGRDAENAMTPRGELPNSQFNDLTFSTLLGFKLAENKEVLFNYQLFNGNDIGIPGASSLFPTIARVSYKFVQRDLFSAQFNWKNVTKSLTNLSLKYFVQNIKRDVENIPNSPIQVNPNTGVKTTVMKILPTGNHYVQGLQLQSDWVLSNNNFLVAGVDFWLRNIDSRRERHLTVVSSTAAINKIIGEKPLPEATFNSLGIYAQDEFSLLNKNLSVTVGGRFDLINISNKKTLQPVYEINNGVVNNTPANQFVTWEEAKSKNNSWSSNIGFLYKITENIDATLNLAKSFRSPSLEERYQFIDQGAAVPLRIGNPDLKPENGFLTDAGLRIWNPKFSLRLNMFVNYMNDLVSEKDGLFDNRSAKIKTNLGKALLTGFDTDIESEIFNKFNVYSIISFVYGEYEETDTSLGSKKYPVPQLPPLNGRIGLRYFVFDFVTIDFASIIFAKQHRAAIGEITTPDYATFDLSFASKQIEYGRLMFRLVAGVENMLDKTYRNHLTTNRGFINIEPGRNIFMKLYTSW